MASTFSPLFSVQARHCLHATLLAAVSATALGAASARAEEVTTLPTITVEGQAERANGPVQGYVARQSASGTKTDTPLIETPQFISVVPRAQLEDQAVSTVSGALRYTPGVVPEVRPTSGRYDSIVMRGFGGGGTDANYVNFLDGLRVARGINYLVPTIEPYGLERIEVVRGPASVLYGQINPGGLVNLVSKRPTAEPYREINLQFGTQARKQIGFDLSGPADPEGRFLYRLTGLYRDADTQVHHTHEQRIYLAPSFTWRPTADTSLTVFGKYQYDPDGGYYGLLPALGTVTPSPVFGRIRTSFFAGEPSYERYSRHLASIGYAFEHRFNDVWSVRQNLRYVDAAQTFGTSSIASVSGSILNRRSVYSQERLRSLAVDSQAEARFSTGALSHTLLFGTDYQQGLSDTGYGVGTAPPINYLNPVYGQTIAMPRLDWTDQYQRQLGFYAQDQIKLDRWIFVVGGRFDTAQNTLIPRTTGQRTVQADTATTGRAAVLYRFDNGIAPYASISTSFEPTGGMTFAGEPFRPSTGRQYEVGVKYQPDGWRGLVQAAFFDLTRQNVLTPDPAHIGFNLQIGEVRVRGVELEARGEITDNLSVIASYAYTDARVTRTTNLASLGKRPVTVPEHTASLWAKYAVLDGALNGLSFGAGIRYASATAGDAANTISVPAYAVVDAMLSYDFGRSRPELKGLSLQVNAHNLFDREFVSGCFAAMQCAYGLRRTVTAGLTYRW